MSGDHVFPPSQNRSAFLNVRTEVDAFLLFPLWTWHINKLVRLIPHKSQGSGGEGIELWLLHKQTQSVTPKLTTWDCVCVCVSDGLSNTFYRFKPTVSFAQKYRYVPDNFITA